MRVVFDALTWEERLMRASASPRRPQDIHFREALASLLSPATLRQAYHTWQSPHSRCRWHLQPLLWVLLLMTWYHGDSQGERFETARAFYVACHQRDRRPGKSQQGFEKALARLPTPVLRAVAAGVRLTLGRPRTPELEQRLGQAGKQDSAPTLWLTTLVLLPLGLLWAWQLGPGTASEQAHALALLRFLPPRALLVAWTRTA
jgi:hypothetical protein